MIKLIISILTFITILFVNGLFNQDATVEINAPAEIEAGQKAIIQITINKKDMAGFARFQQQLPAGLKATKFQTSGSEFTFRDHKLKFIWLNLPSEEQQLKVSYYLEVDEKLKGDFTLAGLFSFIKDNERNTTKPDAANIHIKPSPNVAYSIDIKDFKENYVYEEHPDQIACIRQKPYLNKDSSDYIVNLLVYKKDKDKFAKIEETLPAGYKALGPETKDPIFTFKDPMAKFIWMNLPQDPYFVVSYKIPKNKPVEKVGIHGEFSYVEDGTTQVIEIIERDDIDLTKNDTEYWKDIVESSWDLIAKASRKTKKTEEVVEKPEVPKVETAETEEFDIDKLNPILDPTEGVYYRVQIAAGHKHVNIQRYFKKYKLRHEVKSEMHQGWYKYSIGAFTIYKDARDYRVYIWNSTVIDDAFVAAYNNGQRITVQEALMIAHHKWYK